MRATPAVSRGAAATLAALLLAACGSMNVISEGADGELMLKGYDPVAYFTLGTPTRGRPDIKVEHEGVVYRFASDDHRRLFIAAAAKYVPAYGGFCSNGMVYGIPLGGEPEHFKIVRGRLHLFGGARSKLYFEMDEEKNLRLADHYWETEARDAGWRFQSWKRLVFRVPHYRSNEELAAEYARRHGNAPGG